jgi:PAS domain S-box-containing protein
MGPLSGDTDRYRRTLDSLIEGFQIIGHDWTYLYVNPAAARHANLRPEDLCDRKMWEVFPGIDQSPTFALLSRCMAERSNASVENLFTFPDGTSRWFEVRISPVPEGICVRSLDIDEQKRAQAEGERMARRLHEQAALASIGEMAAVLVHEVKNPLAAVRGALQVISGRVSATDARIMTEAIARLDGLNELMKDLLLFARPPQLRTRPVDVPSIIGSVLTLLHHDPAAKNVTIDVSGSSTAVVADADLVTGVLLNLLLNAVQAMHGEGSIAIRLASTDGFGTIVIEDTGPGIPPEVREKLFRPFFSTKPGGTGLGLATARRIIEEHGGTIAIECPDRGGTRVSVRLPIAADAALA